MSAQLAFSLGMLTAAVPLFVLLFRADSRAIDLANKAASHDRAFAHSQEMYARACEANERLALWRQDHADFVAMAERLDALDERPQIH